MGFFWFLYVNWHLSLVEEYVAEIPVSVVQIPVHAFMEFFLKKSGKIGNWLHGIPRVLVCKYGVFVFTNTPT